MFKEGVKDLVQGFPHESTPMLMVIRLDEGVAMNLNSLLTENEMSSSLSTLSIAIGASPIVVRSHLMNFGSWDKVFEDNR